MSGGAGSGVIPARALAPVLAGIVEVPADLAVSELTLDSRAVTPGSGFVACRGREHHGLQFAPEAVARGARAILWESEPGLTPPRLDPDVALLEVPQLRTQLGRIADRFYEAPSARLAISGITGTNGKTTCAWLLAQALELCGVRAAYLGTLGVGAPGRLQPLPHTTPDVLTLHRLLARLAACGASAVAMEVSSHALDQERCAGVRLQAAAFTNLTREHLDYHRDMQAYGAAKARLFDWPALEARVINVDDPFGLALARRWAAAGPAAKLIVTSRHPPEALAPELRTAAVEHVCAGAFTVSREGLTLEVRTSRGQASLRSGLRGEFNLDNLLTTLALLLARRVPLAGASAALARCAAAPGRMQAEGGGELPLVLIDYAHTPDALAKALAAARALCTNRLWCVFGCGGERDEGKRPQMGRTAAELADALIVTDDNPRGEDPRAIVAAILRGVHEAGADGRTRVTHDRGEAIGQALAGAGAGDVVLVAGKGHEDYQLVGAERRPFSDTAWVRGALALRKSA